LLFLICAHLHAQVTIGGLEEPHKGTVLDLNSTTKGGLILSNVALPNLYTIPANFPGMTPTPADPTDANEKFAGAIVYHTGENNIPAGVYTWNGTNWTPATENCMPLDAGSLKVTASSAFAKVNDPVTFSVSSGAGSRCAAGETYEWHVNGDPSISKTSVYPESAWTTSFASEGDYKVKVNASNQYSDPSSRTSSNEVTVYVTDDGSVPPVLINGNYRISGGICYDVKGPQKNGESLENYTARVDSFATGFTKTFRFIYTEEFQDLLVLSPTDPVGIVDYVSQPASTSGSNSGSISFTVTFKNTVQQLVVANNAPAIVKLLVSYTDNNGIDKIAYLNIRVQDAECYCPAQVSTSVSPLGSLIFMCRNLGATEDIRSVDDLALITNTNFRNYHGDWYKFGAKNASMENTLAKNSVPQISWTNSNYYSGEGNWPLVWDANIGNPCPDGWRLPTVDEWAAVINLKRPNNSSSSFTSVSPENNVITRYQGSSQSTAWSQNNDATPTDNYANILQIGDYLFLPAAGYRGTSAVGSTPDGGLTQRGRYGYYWCSTASIMSSISGMHMYFSNTYQLIESSTHRTYGFSARCVQVE
jgi:uncharacterized protein (TIGR02145 family)